MAFFHLHKTNMKSSFIDTLKTSQETNTAVAEKQEEAQVAEEIVESEEGEEQEYEEPKGISEDVLKSLGNKESFLQNLQDRQREKEEAEALAEQEQEEEESEEEEEDGEEEEEPGEEPEPEKVSFSIGDQVFESIEQVNQHLAAKEAEYAEMQKEITEVRTFVEKISEPELLSVLEYVSLGHSFRVALVKAGFDESLFDVELEDPDAKDLVKAQIERDQAIERSRKEQEKLQKNMEASNKTLSEFQSKEGFDDTVKEKLVTKMAKFHEEVLNGVVSTEFLEIFAKGLNYEKAVEKAENKGEVKGRNEKITIERKKRQGDNIPQLGRGSQNSLPPKTSKLTNLVTIPSGSFMEMLKNKR